MIRWKSVGPECDIEAIEFVRFLCVRFLSRLRAETMHENARQGHRQSLWLRSELAAQPDKLVEQPGSQADSQRVHSDKAKLSTFQLKLSGNSYSS